MIFKISRAFSFSPEFLIMLRQNPILMKGIRQTPLLPIDVRHLPIHLVQGGIPPAKLLVDGQSPAIKLILGKEIRRQKVFGHRFLFFPLFLINLGELQVSIGILRLLLGEIAKFDFLWIRGEFPLSSEVLSIFSSHPFSILPGSRHFKMSIITGTVPLMRIFAHSPLWSCFSKIYTPEDRPP